MRSFISTWKLIVACAEELTAQGLVQFTRKQLIECIQLKDPERKPGTINPIIQGMTINLTGGPAGRGSGRLRSIGRGQFILVERGSETPSSVSSAPNPKPSFCFPSVTLDEYPKRKIAGIEFRHICTLQPARRSDGSIQIIQPQSRYINHGCLTLNRYGAGPFCRFRIPGRLPVAGVYAIMRQEIALYIGECENFSRRFNSGYGLISPRNCFQGGQETNCRINSLVLGEAQAGHILSLYFHPCSDYKELEIRLRREIRPDWNRI